MYTRPCVVLLFSNNVALKRGKRKRERDADTQITEEPLRRGSVSQSLIKLIYLSCCHHLLLCEDYGCHDVGYLKKEEIGKQFKVLCKSNLTKTRTSLNMRNQRKHYNLSKTAFSQGRQRIQRSGYGRVGVTTATFFFLIF